MWRKTLCGEDSLVGWYLMTRYVDHIRFVFRQWSPRKPLFTRSRHWSFGLKYIVIIVLCSRINRKSPQFLPFNKTRRSFSSHWGRRSKSRWCWGGGVSPPSLGTARQQRLIMPTPPPSARSRQEIIREIFIFHLVRTSLPPRPTSQLQMLPVSLPLAPLSSHHSQQAGGCLGSAGLRGSQFGNWSV